MRLLYEVKKTIKFGQVQNQRVMLLEDVKISLGQ